MPEITLKDEIESVVVGTKRLRRDIQQLARVLVEQEGVALAEAPLRSAAGYLTDVLGIINALIPKISAELATKFADGMPEHPAKEETP
jgi:hypothetical protein